MKERAKRTRKKTCVVCKQVSIASQDIKHCPKCGEFRWDKPPIEYKLLNLQDEYLETRSKKIMSKMSEELYTYIRNIIISKLKYVGAYVGDEDVEDMTCEVYIKLYEYYQNPNFKIEDSFHGYLSRMVLQPLFNKKKKERQQNEISMNAKIKASGGANKGITIEDMMTDSMETFLFSEEWIMNNCQREIQINAIMEMMDIIYESSVIAMGVADTNKLMCVIRDSLENKDSDHFKHVWSTYANHELRDKYKRVFNNIYDFIREEIVGKNTSISEVEYRELTKGSKD